MAIRERTSTVVAGCSIIEVEITEPHPLGGVTARTVWETHCPTCGADAQLDTEQAAVDEASGHRCEFQPHYVAWAASNGRTPAEQAAVDTRPDGSFAGHRFELWVSEQHATYRAETGLTRDALAASPERFTAWLSDRWAISTWSTEVSAVQS